MALRRNQGAPSGSKVYRSTIKRNLRIAYCASTAPVQVATSVLLGLGLSVLGRGDASGWGDLIGLVVGLVFGAGIGLAVILVLVARSLGRPPLHMVGIALLSIPGAILISVFAGAFGIGFWAAFVLFLALSSTVVWWYSGRPAMAA